MKDLIVLLGKTASGKNEVAKKLCTDYKYNYVTPFTTRPMRNNEKFGREYYFVSDECFQQISNLNKFYAQSEFRNWYYGILKSDIESTEYPLVIADNKMFPMIFNNMQYNPIFIYLERKWKFRKKSLELRNTSHNEIERRRVDEDKVWLDILQKYPQYIDCVFNNGDIQETVTKVLEVVANRIGD